MGGSPEERTDRARVKRDLEDLRDRLNAVRRQVDGTRIELDDLRDNNSARLRDISRLNVGIEGLSDSQQRVATLEQRFGGLSEGLERALEFRGQLLDSNGELIVDVSAIDERLGDLESLRESLRTASGEIVDIRALEAEINRLRRDVVTPGGLDAAIVERLRSADLLTESGFVDSVTERVRADFDERFETVDTSVQENRAGIVATRNELAASERAPGQRARRASVSHR